jgi:hypothetical protein
MPATQGSLIAREDLDDVTQANTRVGNVSSSSKSSVTYKECQNQFTEERNRVTLLREPETHTSN